ncbi:MAG: RNA 2',3'-cyclic phosphodiesterase [Candidatus Magasanikbacteria bacterium]
MSRRIFISFYISDKAKEALEIVQNTLKDKNRHIRVNWTNLDGLHITVQFLGEIEDNILDIVREKVRDLAIKYNSISFELDKIDAFPDLQHPKVIIAKVFDHSRISNRLQKELTDALVNKGISVDLKIWKPHITLGRNKMGFKLAGLQDIVLENVSWQVDSIEIMESKLTIEGSSYSIVESYRLTNHG